MRQMILFPIISLLATPALAEVQTVEADPVTHEIRLIQPTDFNFEELDKRGTKYQIDDRPDIELNEYLVLGKSKWEQLYIQPHNDMRSDSSWGLVFRMKFWAKYDH